MVFLAALLFHLASIATLFPELAAKTADLTELLVVIQFPLMALAAAAHSIWDDEGEVLRSRLARLSLSFGITYVCILMLAVFDVAVGPADPFGAPESASLATRAGWFIGFSLIASLGSRFFVATSVLDITKALAEPMRRSPAVWYGLVVVVGFAMGGGAVALLDSETVHRFAAESQAKLDANPAPYVIAFMAIPILLSAVARSLRGSRKRD